MPQIIKLKQFLDKQNFFIDQAIQNKIFIYPTDTVYGLGMIYSPENQSKINKIKNRSNKLCSVIAPDFERITNNYKNVPTLDTLQKYLNQYHGVTFIFNSNQPGVRIIKHPFQQFVKNLGSAFISTSANLIGDDVITDIDQLPEAIFSKVDFVIDGGVLGEVASVLIDPNTNTITVR